MNKRAIAMTFNWIFAIIVGAFILFFAIYTANRFIETQENILYTETAAQFISLFDPLATGLASGKSKPINFRRDTKLYFDCDYLSHEPFGKQSISFTEKTFGDRYGEEGQSVPIIDEYIFAEDVIEGKIIYMFSKPLFMPFKVADLIIITADDYCFYNAPEEVREDIQRLDIQNVNFTSSREACEGISVCFGGRDCDINVHQDRNYVQKGRRKLYYKKDLIYAAIFSSPEIYECNIKRLKNKFNELAKIYYDKIEIIERVECKSNVGLKLNEAILSEIESSRDLLLFFEQIEVIDSINQGANSACRLYKND